MTDQHYVHKALGEVIRLADEKIVTAEEAIAKEEQDLNDATRSCDETISEVDYYFSTLMKQLDRWKLCYTQEIQKNISDIRMEFRSSVSKIHSSLEKLKELRETSTQMLSMGHCSNSELVYQVHSRIFTINQELDSLADFVGSYIPLKFVGKLNFDGIEKNEIGTLERLTDLSVAEILPSKLPKIKLGRLFNVTFRISKKYCEAVKRFITYSVTKDDEQSEKVCAYLQDNKNGTYVLSFPIAGAVPHTVNVCYLGEHIRSSPYTVTFRVEPNQIPAMGVTNVQSGGGFQNTNKEFNTETGSAANKLLGRGTGDDREAYKRGKWQNQIEGTQHNNNWPLLSPEFEQKERSGQK